MTRYAIHNDRAELICCWDVGRGETAATVAVLPASARQAAQLELAEALTRLSQALWRCYTHPASAMPSTEPNTEGWRRQGTRDSFSEVLEALRSPNLLNDDGIVIVSYDPVEESAHRIGRALHALDEAEVTAAVLADVAAELAAVEQAERGDLSGRAQQAVMLTRQVVSPVQVAAADQVFAAHPRGTADLLLHFDPAAAAVAAAHWLAAAADVVAAVAEIPAAAVVKRADLIELIPYATPTAVLEMIQDGRSPMDVVVSMIQEAMVVAAGELRLDSAVAYDIATADTTSATRGAPATITLTPLNPHRPARDLLEDLLRGIRACWLVYTENYILDTETPEDAPDDEQTEEIDTSFDQAVHQRATADHDRLT